MISGITAFDMGWLRSTAAFRAVGEMQKKLRELRAEFGGG